MLEKLVHIEDAGLLPDDLMVVEYRVPDNIAMTVFEPDESLQPDWRTDVAYARSLGAAWIGSGAAALLRVLSVACPSGEPSDRDYVVNHAHLDAARIEIAAAEPFELDTRLIAFQAASGIRPLTLRSMLGSI